MIKKPVFAIGFLTVIPVRSRGLADPGIMSGSVPWFPAAGLLIGALLVLADMLFGDFFPPYLAGTMTAVLLILISGGLHLDGLADTADGFYAGKDRQEVMRIMRDSRIGTMGVIAVVTDIMLKTGFLWALKGRRDLLLVMPVISRWSMAEAIALFGYARDEGKAKGFFEHKNAAGYAAAALFSIAVSAAAGPCGLIALAAVSLNTVLMGRFAKARIGGLTGDTLGAINEVNELVVLAAGYVAGALL
ncbi:MAG: adenosylcobinamide-GDP ribazoletransferase [Elusimicrobia bacterium]|nr:adenosylcobinamide-GDP ribazoletransferase [Elusimicrobiota bacterium]